MSYLRPPGGPSSFVALHTRKLHDHFTVAVTVSYLLPPLDMRSHVRTATTSANTAGFHHLPLLDASPDPRLSATRFCGEELVMDPGTQIPSEQPGYQPKSAAGLFQTNERTSFSAPALPMALHDLSRRNGVEICEFSPEEAGCQWEIGTEDVYSQCLNAHQVALGPE